MKQSGSTIEPVMALIATLATSAVAVIQSRFDPDIVAVVGAGLASVISVLEAQEKGRSRAHKISVFIASAFVGSVGPGGFIWTVMPDRAPTFSWQAWAAMGFGFGLLGWAFTSAVIAMRGGVPGFVANLVALFTKKQ